MTPDSHLHPGIRSDRMPLGLAPHDLVRDRFLANICHELRTPINGVMGMLDLLLDTALADEQRRYALTAMGSAERLLAQIDELFDLSLLEAGVLPLQEHPCDLAAELGSAFDGLRSVAREHGSELRITSRLPAGIRVHCDAARLRQLALSMLGCLLKANPGTGLELALDAARDDAGYWRAGISFHNPAGALQAAQDSLSWRFAHGLAEHLGARLELELGFGDAMLRVDLHLAAAPDGIGGLRLLFVGDDPAHNQALGEALAEHGVRADGFGDAGEALKALRTAAAAGQPYRAALLQRRMQGVDGELLGRAIAADPAYQGTRQLLLCDAAAQGATVPSGFDALLPARPSAADVVAALERLPGTAGTGTAPADIPAARARLAGKRILVVDDHIVNQQIATRMLARLGCEAHVAANGQEAVALHQDHRYDLILMDCDMPVMNGYQATAGIRAAENGARHTPVIGWTAIALQEERLRCLGAGMDDFLTKPLRPAALAEALLRWIPQRDAGMPAAAANLPADELESMRDVFGADFRELATLFLHDSLRRLVSLRVAVAEGDCTLAGRIAHSFAGSAASIGANRLSSTCRSLEAAARAGSVTGAAAALQVLEREYDDARQRLQRMTNATQQR